MNLNCDISTLKSRFKRNLQFNNENALVMKRLQLDVNQLDQLMDEELSFTTKGNGLGFMSVKLKYNVILPEKLCKFDLNIELKEWRVDGKNKSQNKKSTNNVMEDSKSKANDLDDAFADDASADERQEMDDFEATFGKDLLNELEGGLNRAKRTRRSSISKNSTRIAKEDKKCDVTVNNDKKLHFSFKGKFEKLKQKDDEQEEIILSKLDHHFELEEDNRMFKYEIDNRQRRSKRSIKESLNRFMNRRKTDSVPKRPLKQKGKSNLNSISDENIRIISDYNKMVTAESYVDDGSFAVYKLKICAQHIPNYDSDMTIIEIGLLTGFEVDKNDLQSKVYDPKANQTHTFTQLSKVEFTDRTVVLYLDAVPHGRPDCYNLKLYQTSQVANLQSGILKVYDYYKKGKVI